jgi:small-conductance mechanosensitive channel
MRTPDPLIAESLWHRPWFSAALSLAVAFAIATLVDRALRGRIVHATVQRTGISRQADTRLRFVRRLISATIVLIGLAVALSYFASVGRLAASLLASGAIAAAVVGFAARQVLANFVAGIMLAVTQPLRVGDWVTFEGNYGVVEDVRLTYTILRTLSDQRVVIPNERLASGVLRNDTLATDRVALDVAVWLPPDADAERAIEALREETGQEVSVAETVPWGTRLAVGGDPVPPPEKAAREAELRRVCLKRLRAEGLLTV